MMGQIMIIKFGVTDDNYQYKGLWFPFVESNAKRTIALFISSEEKNSEKKNKGFSTIGRS